MPLATMSRMTSASSISLFRELPVARMRFLALMVMFTGMVTLDLVELATRLMWVTDPSGTPRKTTGAPMERPLTLLPK